MEMGIIQGSVTCCDLGSLSAPSLRTLLGTRRSAAVARGLMVSGWEMGYA